MSHEPLPDLQQQPAAPGPAVFACIIPSRPVQTQFAHLPPNRFVFQFENPEAINHLVVFLTGIVPLPDDYAASIHFQFPNKPEWQLLGMLSATKPSAIFRLRGTVVRSALDWTSPMTDAGRATATLGILVGPQTEIEASCAALTSSALVPRPASGLPQLAQAVARNLATFLTSFAAPVPTDTQAWVPLAGLEKWWKHFELKIANAPNPEQWLLESAAAG